MRYALYFLSQVAVFFTVYFGLSWVEVVRPQENIAVAAAYGSLIITPMILSITFKDWKYFAILTMILGAWVDSRLSGGSIANPPIIYLFIWGVAVILDKPWTGWLAFATAMWCMFLVWSLGANMLPGTHNNLQLVSNLLFISLLLVPGLRMIKGHAPKTQNSVYIEEVKKAA